MTSRTCLALRCLASVAHAQVSVQEYTVPWGQGIHDVWAVGERWPGVWSDSQGAVYVDDTDRVWASEWRAQVMLRFDPRGDKFEVLR